MANKCETLLIACTHITRKGARIARLTPPSGAERGEALCAACYAAPPDDIANYELACHDCLLEHAEGAN
jgi:hypothetical protein